MTNSRAARTMTFNSLVVPTDGSEEAEQCARFGFKLAKALEVPVHIISVVDSSLVASASYTGYSPSVQANLTEKAQEHVQTLEAEAQAVNLEVMTSVLHGIPAEEIVAYARTYNAGAIVMGTAGRSGVVKRILGSVADKVIRTSPVPVLTLQPTDDPLEDRTFDELLLPTDGSAPADRAARVGLDFAAALDARVHILTVIDPEAEDRPPEAGTETAAAEEDDTASTYLSSLAAEASDRDIEFITVSLTGDPAEEILSYIGSHEVDGVVMGTQGRGRFRQMIVGGVADKVLRRAAVPVMTVTVVDEQ